MQRKGETNSLQQESNFSYHFNATENSRQREKPRFSVAIILRILASMKLPSVCLPMIGLYSHNNNVQHFIRITEEKSNTATTFKNKNKYSRGPGEGQTEDSALARRWLTILMLKPDCLFSTNCSQVGRPRNPCRADTDSDQRYPKILRKTEL